MPSQSVYEFRSSAVRTATASSHSNFASSSLISIGDSPAFARAVEPEPVALNRDGLGCARGIGAAFVLEGGMGMLLYCIWHLWRLVH